MGPHSACCCSCSVSLLPAGPPETRWIHGGWLKAFGPIGEVMRPILRRMMLKGALLGLPCAMTAPSMVRAESFYPDVWPRQLVLPQDHGSHPLFRTEWWYLTGWLGEGESAMGVSAYFFSQPHAAQPEKPEPVCTHPTSLCPWGSCRHSTGIAAPRRAIWAAGEGGVACG